MKVIVYSFLIALMSVPLLQADEAAQRIVVLDMTKAMRASRKMAEAEDHLTTLTGDFAAEQQKMKARLAGLRAEFDELRSASANKAFNEDARAKKAAEAAQKRLEGAMYERKVRERSIRRARELEDQRKRLLKHVLGGVNTIVAEYAKEKGYDLVVDSSESLTVGTGGVIYKSGRFDITDDIVALVEKKNKEAKLVEPKK